MTDPDPSADLPDPRATFPVPAWEAWLAKAEKELRGKPLSSLMWRGEDAWELPPVVRGDATAEAPVARIGALRFCPRVVDYDPRSLEAWLEALGAGADMVRLQIEPEDPEDPEAVDYARALAGIPHDRLLVETVSPLDTQRALAHAVRSGATYRVVPDLGGDDWLPISNATSAQELGAVLAYGVWVLRGCPPPEDDEHDLMWRLQADPAQMHTHVALPLLLGTETLETIAKLRAVRRLWSRVLAAFELPQQPVFVAAGSNSRHLTTLDVHTNLLRTTLQAFAAAAGEADSVTLAAYDDPDGLYEDSPAARLAHNQVRVLLEESYLGRVSDPFAGSYVIESLSERLAEQAWSLFQRIEACGGFAAWSVDLDADAVIGIDASAVERLESVATRRRSVVGVSRFADPPLRPAPNEWLDEDSAGRMREIEDDDDQHAYEAAIDSDDLPDDLPLHLLEDLADPFETLHHRANEFEDDVGERPTVLLLPVGPIGWRRARADFAADFFRAGGFAVRDPQGFDDVAAGIAYAQEHAPDVVVLCSDDPTYPGLAPNLADTFSRGARETLFYVAGRPPEGSAAWGVTGFVYEGIDAVEVLNEALDRLEAERLA